MQIIFYLFSAILLFAALMVILARNPVHGVLFLVLAFVASAALWMLLQAEFLSLVLIFVYVGAVLTLFLFVVMMLNIDLTPLREGWIRFLPAGILVVAGIVTFTVLAIQPQHFGATYGDVTAHPSDYNNVAVLGQVLYTQYVYAFELAAVILLVAIIAAISLTFRGRRNSKTQRVAQQLAARADQRVELIRMPTEKK